MNKIKNIFPSFQKMAYNQVKKKIIKIRHNLLQQLLIKKDLKQLKINIKNNLKTVKMCHLHHIYNQVLVKKHLRFYLKKLIFVEILIDHSSLKTNLIKKNKIC